MTDPPPLPTAAGDPLVCPDCGNGWVTGVGRGRCSASGCAVEVHRFAAVVDRVPEGAAGRCASHPTKDGVAGCTRCGAFICDVCVTRTGERVLCPACFDLLHERGELMTTRASRFRPDSLALALLVLSFVPCCYGVPLPFAFAVSVYGLRRRRVDPVLSRATLVTTLVLTSLGLLAALAGAISVAVSVMRRAG